MFEIELITADGLNLPVDAMFDTGFTGFLAIHKQDLDGLDWYFIRKEQETDGAEERKKRVKFE